MMNLGKILEILGVSRELQIPLQDLLFTLASIIDTPGVPRLVIGILLTF